MKAKIDSNYLLLVTIHNEKTTAPHRIRGHASDRYRSDGCNSGTLMPGSAAKSLCLKSRKRNSDIFSFSPPQGTEIPERLKAPAPAPAVTSVANKADLLSSDVRCCLTRLMPNYRIIKKNPIFQAL
jgi:hypothetical protein